MSDMGLHPNGQATSSGSPKSKRRIAVNSVDGAVGRVQFNEAFGGEELVIDTTKIPAAALPAVTAFGALSIIQNAYNNSKDPVGAAQAMVQRLLSGQWSPGRAIALREPDALLQALAKHLNKPVSHIEDTFLPAYAAKHGLANTGAARRKLREHPDIAPLVANIAAERARMAAAKVRNAPRESLDL